jgi:hypothetical protein
MLCIIDGIYARRYVTVSVGFCTGGYMLLTVGSEWLAMYRIASK